VCLPEALPSVKAFLLSDPHAHTCIKKRCVVVTSFMCLPFSGCECLQMPSTHNGEHCCHLMSGKSKHAKDSSYIDRNFCHLEICRDISTNPSQNPSSISTVATGVRVIGKTTLKSPGKLKGRACTKPHVRLRHPFFIGA
jgi:hypothetical protein